MSTVKPLQGKRILITSGPTRAHLDAVRFISNRSSGRLGKLIALEALMAGADVMFVHGHGSELPSGRIPPDACPFEHLRMREIETVEDLIATLKAELQETRYDAAVHAMAVLDFAPDHRLGEKVPSEQGEWTVKLVKTPKAIQLFRELSPQTFLVGFKLETGASEPQLIQAAHESLKRYNADLVVANDLTQIKAGQHIAHFVNPEGKVEGTYRTKDEIASALVQLLAKRLAAST